MEVLHEHSAAAAGWCQNRKKQDHVSRERVIRPAHESPITRGCSQPNDPNCASIIRSFLPVEQMLLGWCHFASAEAAGSRVLLRCEQGVPCRPSAVAGSTWRAGGAARPSQKEALHALSLQRAVLLYAASVCDEHDTVASG